VNYAATTAVSSPEGSEITMNISLHPASNNPDTPRPHRRWLIGLGAAAAAAALGLTACSSSGSGGGSGGTTPAPTSASSAPASSPSGVALSVASTKLGSILVDNRGRAIYVFAIDKPGQSKCSGVCLQYWPVVSAPNPLPASLPGITAKLGTLKRTDGASQLTVNEYPVYTFAGDTAPGTTMGQGKNLSGGLWWVVSPDGRWITTTGGGSGSSSASSPSSAGSGGYGAGY
jgi:predicted lipoprotein with Yx(FWY)xxD motif